MSKFVHLCCCLTIASTLTTSALVAQQPPEELIDPLGLSDNENQPIELPPPTPIEAPSVDPTSEESHSSSATLRVFVDDGVRVFINDHPTTTPQISGGSRLFTLTELDSSTQYETIVKVRLQDGSTLQSEPFIVEAATHQEVAFPSIATGAAANASELITAGLVPSPMVGPIEQLQDEAAWLAESTATLDDALGKLNTWKEKLDESSETLRAAKEEIEAANKQFKDDVNTVKEEFTASTKENVETAKKTLDDSAAQLKTQLEASTASLAATEKKLVESLQAEANDIKALTERLKIVVNPLLDDGTPAAGLGADRVYKLESEGTKLQATLTYNEALEVSGIHFDASHLKDTISFVDGNQWNSPEVATEGVLKLGLQIQLNNGDPKDFIPDEKYFETIQYESEENRLAKIRFAKDARTNLKKWIEETVAKNVDQTEKIVLDDGVKAILISGEFTLGFADAAFIEKPLEIEILK